MQAQCGKVVIAVSETEVKKICFEAFKYPWKIFVEKPIGKNLSEAQTIYNFAKKINIQKKLTGSQKNIIYFTGHGGKGASKTPYNTTAYLWENAKLRVSDFVKKLDQLPPQQSTILIMVQCYSGGFANVLFQDGDPKKELSKHCNMLKSVIRSENILK